jgi:sulfur-oxidizing protein SoxX
MRKLVLGGFLVSLVCLLTSCGKEVIKHVEVVRNSELHLPEGDAAKGKAAFLKLRCDGCHSIAGQDIPLDDHRIPHVIELGGKLRTVKSKEQLLTAVINPSHSFAEGYHPEEMMDDKGRSLMEVFNREMTVQQMIDIVGFLHGQYALTHPDYEGQVP